MNLQNDEQAITLLLSGGVGVMPTDTLYGLVARAAEPQAVERLYGLKNRERKPGTVVAANTGQLLQLGISAGDIRAVEKLWPNPLSIVLATHDDDLSYLHQGLGDFAVRIPADKKLRDFLLRSGPLVTSSANLPGEQPASTLAEAQKYFGDKPDFYVDGGDLSDRQPSTIARLTDHGLVVLRQGAYDSLGRVK